VWLAERADGQLKRSVALKLPLVSWAPGLAERLQRERDILAALDHPHIARLYDAGLDALGRPWLALEYVQGRPIDAFVRERGLSTREVLALLVQVCDALAHAHGRLVIHRDIKPSNVLVTEDGQVRLLDFGIAKLLEGERAEATALTRHAGAAMTPDYASPEQVRGEPLGTASDVYSLGVLAFELLTGRRPYTLARGSLGELEEAIAAADVPRASDVAERPAARRALRGDLDAVVHKALQKKPADRYAGPQALADDIERHLQGLPVLAQPDSRWYRLGKFARRHRAPLAGVALVIVALGGGLGVALWQAERAERQAERATAAQAFLADIFRTNSDAQPDPLKARNTTARELLDIGAKRIEQNLQADPEGRAAMLVLLGDMYYDLGLDAQAAELYGRQVAALKQAYGPRDRRVALALAHYGRQLQSMDRDEEQRRVLEESRSILDALGLDRSIERAWLLDALARVHAERGREAAELAEQAVAIFRREAPRSEDLARALARLGMQYWEMNESERAEPALEESLRLIEGNPRASVSALLTSRLTLALAQTDLQKAPAAERSFRQVLALTLERNGPEHVDTVHVQARFGLVLHRLGRRDEAWQLLRAAHGTVQRRADQMTVGATIVANASLLRALLAEGRYAEAREPADSLAARWASLGGGREPSYVRTLRLQAEQRLGAGAAGEASRVLADARRLLDELAPGYRANELPGVALMAARLSLAARQPQAALVSLDQISFAPGRRSDPREQDFLRERTIRAEALLALARPEEARRMALDTLHALNAGGASELHGAAEADLQLALGRASQQLGQRAEACQAFERALAWRQKGAGETSPFTAEARAAWAGCGR
jgi:eukaryotic-like serine/threonine-protein kinase